MRNAPPPLTAVFPDGDIPPEANIAPVDVHGIQVPMSAQPEGYKGVIVDLYKKKSE